MKNKEETVYYFDYLTYSYGLIYNKNIYQCPQEAEVKGELYTAEICTDNEKILRIKNAIPMGIKNISVKRKIINKTLYLKYKPKFKTNGFFTLSKRDKKMLEQTLKELL